MINTKEFHLYSVSEFGVVKNRFGKKIKPFLDKDQYLRIAICFDGKQRKIHVHRLVYRLFVGDLCNALVVRHNDSNIKNNHYSNLTQGTQKQNIYDKVKNQTWQAGDFHPGVKYSDGLVLRVRIELNKNGKTTLDALAKKFNVNKCFISDVKRGKRMTREERISKAKERLCFMSA